MAPARKLPPAVKQLCEGVDPTAQFEHLIVCSACGQMIDCRDQIAVVHHSAPRSPRDK